MENCHIGVVQMVSGEDVTANLERAKSLVSEAASRGAELVLLPENFAHLADRGSAEVAEKYKPELTGPDAPDAASTPIQFALQHWARDFGIWIVAGAVPLSQRSDRSPVPANRTRSASLLYSPEGELKARYDKIHLFDVTVADAAGRYRESASIERGNAPCAVDSPFGTLGLSICFDLRFPELYRLLAKAGAEILTVPSAFTHTTGEAHWITLLRARAIENGCYVIAANQGGQHSPKRRTWGHSAIIDPWGEILAEAGEGEAVLVAEIKGDKLHSVRNNMPLLSMRRL